MCLVYRYIYIYIFKLLLVINIKITKKISLIALVLLLSAFSKNQFSTKANSLHPGLDVYVADVTITLKEIWLEYDTDTFDNADIWFLVEYGSPPIGDSTCSVTAENLLGPEDNWVNLEYDGWNRGGNPTDYFMVYFYDVYIDTIITIQVWDEDSSEDDLLYEGQLEIKGGDYTDQTFYEVRAHAYWYYSDYEEEWIWIDVGLGASYENDYLHFYYTGECKTGYDHDWEANRLGLTVDLHYHLA